MSDCFNIYMTGVGGQGIGLLSQSLLMAIDLTGIKAVAVDTHGLAATRGRGGIAHPMWQRCLLPTHHERRGAPDPGIGGS